MKKKEIIIETPEKITFSYTISEVGTRIAAYILDTLIQGAVLLLFFLLIYLVGFPLFAENDNIGKLSFYVMAFYLILVFILRWFYYVFFEVKMEGQTPGKKAARIRVIRSDGGQLDFPTIVLRNFLRAVDGFPFIPLTGGFIAMIDKKNRRLGDLVAGTIVVNEIYFNLKEPSFYVKFENKDLKGINEISTKLNEEDLYVIRRFLNERDKLPQKKQTEVAQNLAEKVKEKLENNEVILDPVNYLERIYKYHGSEN